MQEGAIMEVVKWFVGLLLLFTIVSVTFFAIELSAVNNYKQQVNYEIERNGGLTTEALADLESYSEDNYNGRFTIESDQKNQKVPFGDSVDYIVKANLEFKLMPMVDGLGFEFGGTGVSYVR